MGWVGQPAHPKVQAAIEDAIARIKDALQKSTGKKVVVESIVDPTLLGGLRIQVEGKILDSTLLLQLEALRGLILTAA